MLTETDLNQQSGRLQSALHMAAAEDSKGTKDRTQADMVVGKNLVTPEGAQKAASGQKELLLTTEPMKTRRSQLAEESKVNTAAPAVQPEVERVTVPASGSSLHEKELKNEDQQDKKEPLVKNINPAEAGSRSEEELASVQTSAEQNAKVSVESNVPSEPLKRASFSQLEGGVTPEKRLRMSSVSSVSSVSSISPPASSTSSPPTPVLATNQRVPPLKVHCPFTSVSSHLYQKHSSICFKAFSNKCVFFFLCHFFAKVSQIMKTTAIVCICRCEEAFI